MKKFIFIPLTVMLILMLTACSGSKEVTDMPFSTKIGSQTLDGIFSGTIENKLPHGQGTFTYTDDSIIASYAGNWSEGILVGEGTLNCDGFIVKYGDVSCKGHYEGATLNGIPNGNGTFVSSDGEVVLSYLGDWIDGTIAGNGELEFDKYTINFNDRILTGTFKGSIDNGVPSGMGKFFAATENDYLTYVGNWENGTFSDDGSLDTNIYSVTFLDGITRIGKYVGSTFDGLASGTGSFTATIDTGESYTHIGEWVNGLPNGYGCRKWDSQNYPILEGNYINGDFMPIPLEYFIAEGTRESANYTIIDKAQDFLLNNPDLFLTNDLTLYEGEIDNDFLYKAFAKNQSTYGDKLVKVSGRIGQIFEDNHWGADHTFCLIYDDSYNFYFVFMYGFAENIYEGDWVTMTALPLDYFTWTSAADDLVWSIACAAVKIEK